MLLDACAVAGVDVGAYDARIIDWLAWHEDATRAVTAGLIIRGSRPTPD